MDTPGIDLSALQQLQSLMQPTEEEQKQARSRALILAGAGLLGVPKGQTMRGIGRAIGGGLLSYQNDLHDISATKAQNLHAADTAMGVLAKQRAFADADLLRQQQLEWQRQQAGQTGAGGPQGAPGASGAMPAPQASPAPAYGMQDRSVGEAPAPTPPIAAGGAPAPTSAVSNRRALAQQYWQAAAYWKTKEGKGAMDLAQHYADQAVKAEPVLDKTEVHTLPGTNQRVVVKIYKDGSHEVVPELAPDLGKLMLVNNGKYQIGVDDITGDHRLSVENTLSPHDEKMLPLEERRTLATESNARATQAQAGLAQQRLAWEQQGGAGQLEKDANGNLVRVRGTAAEPVTQGGEPVKAFQQMPEGLREKLAQNTVTLSKIDEALGGLAKHPAAVGPSNMLPMADTWKQYTDPKGVELRAIIAGIGGQKFHDLSGAAVSVSEAARLKPYIPSVDDGPHKSAIKLANLKRELDLMNAELARGVPLAQVINRTPTAGTKYEGFSAEAHQ